MKKRKPPIFKSEKAEREFWQENDSTEYVDWSKASHADFPNLKPSTKTISLRLPEPLLNEIKVVANKNDVPYQSLMKIMLAEKLQEMHK